MDIYPKYISPLGYQIGDDLIDTYGVNHNKFNLRDEIEYQNARINRENKMMENYQARGINKNYPQYSTNFWNSTPDNNYGFGDCDILNNIENMENNSGKQYAQNILPQIASDVTQNPHYISDSDLYQKMWNNIKRFEAIKSYPYLDTKGNITIGGGSNINNYNDFIKVNFLQHNISADKAQKDIAFNKLNNMRQQRDINGNYLYTGTPAEHFEPITNLRITENEAYDMAQNHMKKDLAYVRKEFPDFDYFPNQLKEVLLDIQYNTGSLNKQNWPKLYNAINKRDVKGIASNVHRKDVGNERNDWAEKMTQSIRF